MTTLKPWRRNQQESRCDSSKEASKNPTSDGGNHALSRFLVAIWIFVGILTYEFDAKPLNAWVITWAAIASVTAILLCCVYCREKVWLLRCWRQITCRDCCRKANFDVYQNNDNNNGNARSKRTMRQLLGTVCSISMPYFRENRGGRCLFLAMLIVVLLNSASSVLFSFASKNFYNALNSGDIDSFRRTVVNYAAILFVYAPVIALYNYQRERLAVHWRKWTTERTLQLYGQNRRYYFLEREGEIDNPDQRIAEDINAFCTYSLKLLVMAMKNTINLISFSIILYSIAPQLFLVILGYVFAGSIVTLCLGKPLVSLNFKFLQREADFRFSLVRLRENAESVAFYGGEALELSYINKRFDKVIMNRIAIIWKELQLEIFTNIYFYMTWILPVAIVAPQYFRGELELGSVTQAREAFHHVLSDISILIHEFADISKFSAGISRLGSFYDAMNKADAIQDSARNNSLVSPEFKGKNHSSDEASTSSSTVGSDCMSDKYESKRRRIELLPLLNTQQGISSGNVVLGVNQLTLWTPRTERVLIRDLNFSLREGQNLMIVGSSGTGKSSLLRCIAGLWNTGEGTIELPSKEHVYFLPQRPYCALGSLRDQLLYPSFAIDSSDSVAISVNNKNKTDSDQQKLASKCRAGTDQELLDILNLVQLSKLAYQVGNGDPFKGLDAVEDWSNILSLGEQQRLGFARVFVNRPRLLIMDEATSALDTTSQSQMYRILEHMANASRNHKQKVMIPVEDGDTKGVLFQPIEGGLTYVSVGHQPSLLAYHCKKLVIRETGYDLRDIDKEKVEKVAAAASADLFL